MKKDRMNQTQQTSKKSFLLYSDAYGSIKELSQEEKGDLLDVIYLYSMGESLIEMTPMVKLAFSFIKRSLDKDTERYISKCETNKENGKLGGRPKKPKETERLLEKANGYSNNPENLNTNTNNNNKNIKRDNTPRLDFEKLALKSSQIKNHA